MANEFVFETIIEIKVDPRLRQFDAQLDDVIQIAARNIESRAKQLVPVDTGDTQSSIEARSPKKMEWRIGPTTEYAPFLEFGTERMSARPYLIPSIEHEKPRIKKAIEELIRKLSS